MRWPERVETRSKKGRTLGNSMPASVIHGPTKDANRNRRGNREHDTASGPKEHTQGMSVEGEQKSKDECYQKEHLGKAIKYYVFQAANYFVMHYLESLKSESLYIAILY